jgi:ribonuclease HI
LNIMLRHLHPSAVLFLLALFNVVWLSGSFPLLWSTSVAIPVPKPGKDPMSLSGYRIIHLTVCTCKILERMVYRRLMSCLEGAAPSLSPYQFGFRRFRSPAEPLLRLDHEIRQAFRAGECVLGVFFDLERAYDSTWRGCILQRLHALGFRGLLPAFIVNLLSHRSFVVKVGGRFSRSFPQNWGVPQGGVLSVLLFALAIDDLPSSIPGIGRDEGVQCSLYVDDFALYISGAHIPILAERMQLAVDAAAAWATSYGFSFSLAKTQCILFRDRARKDERCPVIYLADSALPNVHVARFLGLLFEEDLSWRVHIAYLKTSCYQALNTLRRLSFHAWGADRAMLLRLYILLVRSRLDYGSQIYGQAKPALLKSLDPVQNEGIRIATKAHRSSSKVALEAEACIPPLHLRRRSLMVKLFLRMHHLCLLPMVPLLNEISREDTLWPFAVVVRAAMSLIGQLCPKIWRYSLNAVPPWLFPPAQICLSMSGTKKADLPAVFHRGAFREHEAAHPGATPVFTDGSRSEAGVAAAVVFPDESFSHTLPSSASIFTAELIAILIALYRMAQVPDMSFVIYSDSMSALQALKATYPTNPLVLAVQQFLFILHSRMKTVVFCWVPSHVGIGGNERADKLAVAACSRPMSCGRLLPPTILLQHQLPYWDYFPEVDRLFATQWQSEWEVAADGAALRSIKPHLARWPSSSQRCRLFEVILARLRIGHTRLTHGYLMCRDTWGNPPWCQTCDVQISIEHVLLDCTDYDVMRSRAFPGLSRIPRQRRLSLLLSDGPTFQVDGLISFLRQADLLHLM